MAGKGKELGEDRTSNRMVTASSRRSKGTTIKLTRSRGQRSDVGGTSIDPEEEPIHAHPHENEWVHGDAHEEEVEDPGRPHSRKWGKKLARINDWKLTTVVVGGPSCPELLESYLGHVAYQLWEGKVRKPLRCQHRTSHLEAWSSLGIEQHAARLANLSTLTHLRTCMFSYYDVPLISAFVERWHPETNSFHMPFGEMTITLHDVFYILQIPVGGRAVDLSQEGNNFEPKSFFTSQIDLPLESLNNYGDRGGFKFEDLRNHLASSAIQSDILSSCFLLYILEATLFMNKSVDRFRVDIFALLQKPSDVRNYAWGAAGLAFLYRQLGMASRADAAQLSGCITLLEAWIYEYFPMFRPQKNGEYTLNQPRAMQWDKAKPEGHSKNEDKLVQYRRHLDVLRAEEVDWLPFGRDVVRTCPLTLFQGCIRHLDIVEPYMPDRVLRQFGFVQSIPPRPIRPRSDRPEHVYRPAEIRRYKAVYHWEHTFWDCAGSHLLTGDDLGAHALLPWDTSEDYMEWFVEWSHVRVTPPTIAIEDALPISHVMTADTRLELVAQYLRPIRVSSREHMSSDQIYGYLDAAIGVIDQMDALRIVQTDEQEEGVSQRQRHTYEHTRGRRRH